MVDAIRGKYRIVREIARSNDIVYEAVDNTLGRRIALKELNISSSLAGQARRERIERFNREARAAGKLSHPNIVAVTDCFEENGRYFIVMEYLEGQTLRDVMQVRGALPLQDAIGIACQVLDALSHAHQHHVVHRDIKPDNIFILPGGLAKLADFGIARLSEEPALTSDGQVFGTPSYMSPEQIEGRGIDHRSDLFSLGVLLYEMLTGRKPFVGDSVISITYAVMNAEPPQMIGVPTGVEQVIRHALSKNPNARQTSADQMKLDLRNAEQTPALFLPQTQHGAGSGRTGYGLSPQQQQAVGYGSGYAPTAAPYGYNPPRLPPAAYPSAPQPQGGLPWSWTSATNTASGSAAQQQAFPSVMPGQLPYTQQGYPPSAHGVVPYAAPPYPQGPPAPLFVLTPSGRAFLLSIIAAAVIGGGIAFGVIGLQNGYSHYQQTAGAQRVTTLISSGAAAYNSGDYDQAASLFVQALDAGPTPDQRTIISKNLAFTYVQQARAANARGDWQSAERLYRAAIEDVYDYDTPHRELADLLLQHGDSRGAEEQRSAASSSGAADTTPSHIEYRPPASSATIKVDDAASTDPKLFLEQQRIEARRLIDEGKTLARDGRIDEARDRWQTAIGNAPGTPERDEAATLLDQYPPRD